MFRLFLSLALSVSLISCQTITIQPEGQPSSLNLSGAPDFEESQDFFFWGLAGESVIPAGKICGDRAVAQLQSQTAFLDGLWPALIAFVSISAAIGLIAAFSKTEDFKALEQGGSSSLAVLFGGIIAASVLVSGIYKPKTAKVWCGENFAKDEGESQ